MFVAHIVDGLVDDHADFLPARNSPQLALILPALLGLGGVWFFFFIRNL